jgi:hypothetical protein
MDGGDGGSCGHGGSFRRFCRLASAGRYIRGEAHLTQADDAPADDAPADDAQADDAQADDAQADAAAVEPCEDGAALFARFMRLADALRMHPDERCEIAGLSVETWREIRRGVARPEAVWSARVMRRVGYAIGLMQRTLDNRAAEAVTPPPPAAPPAR